VSSPGAVVIGGYINGLGLVRALAARQIRTAVVTTKPYDIAHRSRYVSARAAALETDEQPESLVDLLLRRASDWAGWALFPTNDGALAALAQHRDRLMAHYRVVAPSSDVARYLVNKELMLEAAQAVGVAVPRCYGAAVRASLALSELAFPVVVKPIVGHQFFARFGCKLFVAHDQAGLLECLARIEDAQVPCRVFDLVPGPDSQIYAYCVYMHAGGEPSAGLTVRKIRQSPPFFGVARVAEVAADNPALREATIEILRRIGFRGMAAAEFKLDPRDGTFRFMEVNGRSVLYNALLRKAGLDLSGLAWSDYVHGNREPARPNGWPGVWVNLHADLLYSVLYRRHDPVRFADFLAPYTRKKIDAVWSLQDPVPFLAQWSRTGWEGTAALWRGKHRQLLRDRTRPASAL